MSVEPKIVRIISWFVDKKKLQQTAKQAPGISVIGGKLFFDTEIELVKIITHNVITDEELPIPESMIQGIVEITIDGDKYLLSLVSPLSDLNIFIDDLKERFNKIYKQPRFGAKNYVRNSRLLSLFKMGFSDAALADMELAPLVRRMKIDIYSHQYDELVKNKKDEIRQARKQFEGQLRTMLDN